MGTMFWNMTQLDQLPETGMHANEVGQPVQFIDAHMYNMGLCMSPSVMFNKFLIALAFSEIIHDDPPDENWYEDKWLNVSTLELV